MQPGEVPNLSGIPARKRPSYELRDLKEKKYYCPECGNSTGNHETALTHVRRDHLHIALACPYCEGWQSPSYNTYRDHFTAKHPGALMQAPPVEEEDQEAVAQAIVKISHGEDQ